MAHSGHSPLDQDQANRLEPRCVPVAILKS